MREIPLDIEVSCPRCSAPLLAAKQTAWESRLVIGQHGPMIESSATWLVPRHRCEDLP